MSSTSIQSYMLRRSQNHMVSQRSLRLASFPDGLRDPHGTLIVTHMGPESHAIRMKACVCRSSSTVSAGAAFAARTLTILLSSMTAMGSLAAASNRHGGPWGGVAHPVVPGRDNPSAAQGCSTHIEYGVYEGKARWNAVGVCQRCLISPS